MTAGLNEQNLGLLLRSVELPAQQVLFPSALNEEISKFMYLQQDYHIIL